VTLLRRLITRRSEREATGRFVVDGPHLVAEGLLAGLVDEVFVDVAATGGFADLLDTARRAGVTTTTVASGVLARVADPVTPQAVLAVARRPAPPSVDGVASGGGGVLVCDALSDPGNLGTLIRVAEAAGLSGVWCVGGGTDPFGPKAVRASAGSVLRVPVAVEPDGPAAVGSLAEAGFGIVGLRGDGAPYDAVDLAPPVAIVVGSEAHGISDAVATTVTTWVGIPMAGEVESLNAGVAGAVVAFEVARRRRTGSGPNSGAR